MLSHLRANLRTQKKYFESENVSRPQAASV